MLSFNQFLIESPGNFKVKRKDGKVFEFHVTNIGRGKWGYAIEKVNGQQSWRPDYGDFVFGTEREARKHAKEFVDKWYQHPQYGWVM